MTPRDELLAWFDAHRRALPWREAISPWRVWVSEIMCQQTRVDSVIPYFQRFMARFPTPAALAVAPQAELLSLWAGLGYYSRARNLQKAAQQVIALHGGEVPADPAAFRALAGVGRYTCGAVQSIAFGRPTPAVDGNVIRVLSRFDLIEEDPRTPAVNRRIWARAAELSAGPRPGDLNQALMELGALVCRPRSPACHQCPLQNGCAAHAAGVQEALPRKAPRKPRPVVRFVAGLARQGDAIWMARRAGEALLGGLWELPAVEADQPGALAALGLDPGDALATVTHGFTHRVWEIHVFAATGTPTPGDYAEVRAVPGAALKDLGLSGPGIKALRAAGLKIPHRRGAGRR